MEEKPTGKAAGGKARAAKMTPEERKASSQRAVEARKAKAALPKATHMGELKLGEESLQCAVLPDGSRVISQRGVASALGRKYGGNDYKIAAESGDGNLPIFLSLPTLKPFISNDLMAVATSPVLYTHSMGGGVAQGIDASMLPQVCDVWLKARDAGVLTKSQLVVAQKADILMRALAHVGIIALVDEATGYQRDREKDALAKILEAFVAKELQPWLKTFPDEYYKHIFRLYGLQYPPAGKSSWRPGFIGKLTNDVVYARIAPELLPELKRAATRAQKKAKLHQWLTEDLGHPKLREHLSSIVTLLKLSRTPEDFKEKVDMIHPRLGQTYLLDFDDKS
ncbi:P63C domain-containing protein [Chromobacterium violaceum]|uniref:P63C domain-containing protein n=1 Tax=Chromobacterium violaceum TaxID=536 RepID=UPI001E341215|nr:P63C domain-containing protein [Chromobacterium violaceum]MCD0492313.1 P63C domain-containing protein [Chromobacterium violaceum]